MPDFKIIFLLKKMQIRKLKVLFYEFIKNLARGNFFEKINQTKYGFLFQGKYLEEPKILRFLINNLSEREIFLNIGAHHGYYSLLTCFNGLKTYAFEPDFNNLKILYKNII